MSVDGVRISALPSKSMELSKYMATVLDEDWTQARGMDICAVGIASISYDDESKALINMRNQGAMMGDPSVREGFVQSAVAKGLQSAGSNRAGAGQAYMAMGMGMQGAGNFMASASATNAQQMQQQAYGICTTGHSGNHYIRLLNHMILFQKSFYTRNHIISPKLRWQAPSYRLPPFLR